jgi:hypothetical protein
MGSKRRVCRCEAVAPEARQALPERRHGPDLGGHVAIGFGSQGRGAHQTDGSFHVAIEKSDGAKLTLAPRVPERIARSVGRLMDALPDGFGLPQIELKQNVTERGQQREPDASVRCRFRPLQQFAEFRSRGLQLARFDVPPELDGLT